MFEEYYDAAAHVIVDGVKWYEWLVEYPFGPNTFSFTIFAPSYEEAMEMLSAIKMLADECDLVLVDAEINVDDDSQADLN